MPIKLTEEDGKQEKEATLPPMPQWPEWEVKEWGKVKLSLGAGEESGGTS